MNIQLYKNNVPIDITNKDFKLFKSNVTSFIDSFGAVDDDMKPFYCVIIDYKTFFDIDKMTFLSPQSEKVYMYKNNSDIYTHSELRDLTGVDYELFTYCFDFNSEEEMRSFIEFYKDCPMNYNILRDYYHLIFNKKNKDLYKQYLTTEYWYRLSEKIKAMYGYKCMLCGCTESKLHVHHNNYKSVGYEDIHDLIPICEECHIGVHNYKKLNSINIIELT